MSSLTHIMVDLETLGVVPGCVVLSIGAVQFFPEERRLGDEHYSVINIESSLAHYLREEQATRDWWSRQSGEALQVLDHAFDMQTSIPLPAALSDFNAWQQSLGNSKSIRLYGNGADFDNPILRVMYDAANVKPYAYPYGGRCYRTLKSLDELFGDRFAAPKLERTGTYHNALDDAKSQAKHLMDIICAIRDGVIPADELNQE